MSTRSGKRIHSSIEEHFVENMSHLKSERNTRSKLQKTAHDLPLTEKKRKHYVRYPSDEEITSTDNGNIEITAKNTRKSRRHTLKEQNKLVTDSEPTIDVKAERSTRRTKKISVKSDLDSVELTLIKEVTEGKKKGKKKKSAKSSNIEENIENVPDIDTKIITKKKTNKKKNKKKSNSLVTDASENVNKKLNKSNASNDSFHSAAGSPVVDIIKKSNNKNGVSYESPKIKKNKRNVLDEESNMNTSVDTPNKKRKQTVETDDMTCKQLNGLVTNSVSKELLSEPDKSRSSVINEIESVDNKTFEKDNSLSNSLDVNSKINSNKKASFNKTDDINTTFEIDNNNKLNSSTKKLKLSTKRSSLNNTFESSSKEDTSKTSMIIGNLLGLNATFDMESNPSDAIKTNDGINDITYSGSKKKRKSSIKNSTYDKIDETPVILNATFEKELIKNSSITNSLTRDSKSSIVSLDQNRTESLNSTYDKNSKAKTSINGLNATFDKPYSLDSTFDKSLKKDSIDHLKMRPKAKSSLLSSDATDNSSLNITDDNSHVSINSDDSKLDNIVNTTPVLVESSMDESKTDSSEGLTDSDIIKNSPRREETFTDEDKTSPSNKENIFTEQLKTDSPLKKNITLSDRISPKQASLSDSACTPLINTITTPKKKVGTETKLATTPLKREGTFTKDSPDVMTHKLSKEITPRRKSLPSPGYTPYPGSKSSLKEKSVLNVTRSIEKSRRSSIAEAAPRLTRVMFCSPTNNPAVVTQMKGKIIKSNLKGSNKSFVFDDSVSESSRPTRKRSYTQSEAERATPTRARTASAAGRLQEPPPRRTKLPNFAALHRKQFARMESLDAWQRRRSERARRLHTPPAPAAPAPPAPPETQKNASQADVSTKKIESPKTKQPSAVPGFNKFGFKLNLDVNPFSFPSKNTEVKPKEKKPVTLKRQTTLPSLAGATALRKEIAKQTIMREKSLAEKKNVHRNETRTVIKGVRTNRRFELQMKMRNIDN